MLLRCTLVWRRVCQADPHSHHTTTTPQPSHHHQCARYFVEEEALAHHLRTKLHKKRMRVLKDTPYSQAEADQAAGMGSYTIQHKVAAAAAAVPVAAGAVAADPALAAMEVAEAAVVDAGAAVVAR